jgi:two-component system, LytTR family, sensor kinase
MEGTTHQTSGIDLRAFGAELATIRIEMARDIARKRLLICFLGFGFWTLIGLSFASQFYLSSLKAGRTISWLQAVAWSLGDWYVWALLSIPIVWIAQRFRIEGRSWKENVAIHIGASALLSIAYMLIRALIGQWQTHLSGNEATFLEAFKPLLLKTFHFNVLIYWVIVSVTHAVSYYRQFREREVQTAELEKNLTQAKLQTLQMQLNPHFLFNTLHAISALMHKDVDAADRMMTRLSELLRTTLESNQAHEIPLRQELSFLERYLEIEQTRFGSRLKVKMDIAPETFEALVPNLLLQPIVENAIQHGIEPRAKGGEVGISAKRVNDDLILQVRDNGAGLADDSRDGVGLSNTRSRLAQLYGKKHHFEMRNIDSGGLAVTASIPFHTAGSEASLVTSAAANSRKGEPA